MLKRESFIKEQKYTGYINIYTSIIFNYARKEIRVCNDAGRLTRPLLRVKNGKLLLTSDIIKRLQKGELTWRDLLCINILEESVIEYIDASEQNLSMIAMKPEKLLCKKKGNTDFIFKFTPTQFSHCCI